MLIEAENWWISLSLTFSLELMLVGFTENNWPETKMVQWKALYMQTAHLEQLYNLVSTLFSSLDHFLQSFVVPWLFPHAVARRGSDCVGARPCVFTQRTYVASAASVSAPDADSQGLMWPPAACRGSLAHLHPRLRGLHAGLDTPPDSGHPPGAGTDIWKLSTAGGHGGGRGRCM